MGFKYNMMNATPEQRAIVDQRERAEKLIVEESKRLQSINQNKKNQTRIVNNNDGIVSIRILPMSKLEFPNMTYEDIQNNFFMDILLKREKCKYFYRKKGMSFTGRTLVLFQFNNEIIASAELVGVEKDVENSDVLHDGQYKGAFCFDYETIKIFKPITAKEIVEIDESFTGFSQSKKKLDISKLNDVILLINSKENISVSK